MTDKSIYGNKIYHSFCLFYRDLRDLREKESFADSFSDEVTKVEFSKFKTNLLLTSCLDGIITLFDLGKENEEDAIETSTKSFQISNIDLIENSLEV